MPNIYANDKYWVVSLITIFLFRTSLLVQNLETRYLAQHIDQNKY
jgi:hypothetical protein